jgi:hypothetical protein
MHLLPDEFLSTMIVVLLTSLKLALEVEHGRRVSAFCRFRAPLLRRTHLDTIPAFRRGRRREAESQQVRGACIPVHVGAVQKQDAASHTSLLPLQHMRLGQPRPGVQLMSRQKVSRDRSPQRLLPNTPLRIDGGVVTG